MNSYEATEVSVEKSQAQIRELLKGFKVRTIRFTSFPAFALLEFIRELEGEKMVPYRITVLPKLRPKARNTASELDRAERQVWRVAYWWLKAKLEAIEFGLVEFEREFLPNMLVSDSQGRTETVAEALGKRLLSMGPPNPDDPFGGLRPALPPKARGEERQ